MKLSLVVAVSRSGVIGKDGGLPWEKIPEDMANFRQITMGHGLIMGRKTWQSLDGPLEGRRNVVLSRSTPYFNPSRAVVALNPSEALVQAYGLSNYAFVIGGAQIYRLFAPLCDEMHITMIDREIEGDTHFPWDIIGFGWDIRETRELATDVRYEHLVRKSS